LGSTLAQLRASTRIVLQETTAEFFTDPEINAGIVRSYQKYTLNLIEDGEGYFESTFNIALVSGQEAYNLETLIVAPNRPFFSIARVERIVQYGFIPLNPSERRIIPTYNIGTGVGDSYRPTYRMRGMALIFEPAPQFSQADAVRLGYYYLPVFPTQDTDTFDSNFSSIYEQMIIDRAAIFCLENKDASGAIADVATIRTRLADMENTFFDSMARNENPDSVQYAGVNYKNLYGYF